MNYRTVNLNEVCRPKQWKTISMSEMLKEGYPLYGANGKIGFYKEYSHEYPTLLITCRGATCGEMNISEPKSYINGNAMTLDNLSGHVELKYLYYYLKKRGFKDIISGSAQPQITRQGLSKVEIPLPPLETQKKIAAILDKADELRRNDQKILEKYDQLIQSVFLEMFGDPVRNQKKYSIGTIKDLVSEVKYGTSAKANANGRYPYIRMNNITYSGFWNFDNLKYIDLTEKDRDKYLARKGDILFNRTNSKELVGKTGVYDLDESMAIAGYLIRVRVNELANPYYIWGYLNSMHGKMILENMCKSIVGMANINAQELQGIEILKPPISLQNKYESIIREINNQKEITNQSLQKSEELFQSLLQKAFKGGLV